MLFKFTARHIPDGSNITRPAQNVKRPRRPFFIVALFHPERSQQRIDVVAVGLALNQRLPVGVNMPPGVDEAPDLMAGGIRFRLGGGVELNRQRHRALGVVMRRELEAARFEDGGGETAAFAVGPALVLAMLAVTGFQSSTADVEVAQPASAVTGVLLSFTVLPAVLAAVSLLLLRRYRTPS